MRHDVEDVGILILRLHQELQRSLDDPRVVVRCAKPLHLRTDYLASDQLDASPADIADVNVLPIGADHLKALQQRGRDAYNLDYDIGTYPIGQL